MKQTQINKAILNVLEAEQELTWLIAALLGQPLEDLDLTLMNEVNSIRHVLFKAETQLREIRDREELKAMEAEND